MYRFLKRKPTDTPDEIRVLPESSEISESSTATGKRKIRVFKFNDKWKDGRPWLCYNAENGQMSCSFCKKFKPNSQTNKFVVGCDSLRIENVRSHEISSDHKVSHSSHINSLKGRAEQPLAKAVINMEKSQHKLMNQLFRTAFYIAKNEKPFTDFVKLIELQAVNFSESSQSQGLSLDQHYNNDKQARHFISYIAQVERMKKLDNIRQSEFIGVASDGCTDSANLEEESFYVSYLDKDFIPKLDFLKIKSVKGRASADELATLFFQVFDDLEIDVKRKCVHLATDGPAVMRKTCEIIKEEITWTLQFHCSNHRLELAFKDAVKGVNLETDAHVLLDGLYHFYHNSSLQSRCLTNCCALLEISALVHPKAKGTRWLAHRERAVKALDRNYAGNVAQLQACNLDKTQTKETRAKALGLKEKLIEEDLVIFMFAILKPLLAIYACLSCLLQSDEVSIDTLKNTVKRTKTKLNNFDCENEIRQYKESNFNDKLFRDVELKTKKTGSRGQAENKLVQESQSLVTNLKTAIIDRLGPLGDGNIGTCPEIAMFAIFDVSVLPDSDDDDLSQYGKTEIRMLTSHFANLLESKGYDTDKIEDERENLWEHVRYVLKTTNKEGRTIRKFWPKILRKKGDSDDLKNILSLVKILLVLVLSTAKVERGFSLMKRVKSDWRTKLNETGLNDLMLISLSEESVSTFDPEPSVKLWWTDPKRRRLVKKYGPRQPNASTTTDIVLSSSDSDSESLSDGNESESLVGIDIGTVTVVTDSQL